MRVGRPARAMSRKRSVGQDGELLRGAVGAVVAGGHDVEGELPLELPEGFLLPPRPQTKAYRAGRLRAMVVATA